MGLFDRKPKVSIKQWCHEFYGSSIFAPPAGGADLWETFCACVRKRVSEADPAILSVDRQVLSDQLLSLRLEVIGVAWMMRVKDDFSPKQSQTTHEYLADHNHHRFWDMMEPYNQAVAKATVGGVDGRTPAGRAQIAFLNSMRAQLFDKWSANAPAEHAARAANRFGSEVPWKSQRTHTYLSFGLTDQLKCDVNEEARIRLMAVIQGFFNGASESLDTVKIVP